MMFFPTLLHAPCATNLTTIFVCWDFRQRCRALNDHVCCGALRVMYMSPGASCSINQTKQIAAAAWAAVGCLWVDKAMHASNSPSEVYCHCSNTCNQAGHSVHLVKTVLSTTFLQACQLHPALQQRVTMMQAFFLCAMQTSAA